MHIPGALKMASKKTKGFPSTSRAMSGMVLILLCMTSSVLPATTEIQITVSNATEASTSELTTSELAADTPNETTTPLSSDMTTTSSPATNNTTTTTQLTTPMATETTLEETTRVAVENLTADTTSTESISGSTTMELPNDTMTTTQLTTPMATETTLEETTRVAVKNMTADATSTESTRGSTTMELTNDTTTTTQLTTPMATETTLEERTRVAVENMTADATSTESTRGSTTMAGIPPPQCSPVKQSVSLEDGAETGTCINSTVQCTDPAGGQLKVDLLGTTGPLIWTQLPNSNNLTSDALLFHVCVNESLYHHLGLHELELRVSNTAGVTSVTFSVTIDDVNQAPKFLANNWTVFLALANTTSQTSVAQIDVIASYSDVIEGLTDVIYVWDPDNITEKFGFSNVRIIQSTVVFPNQTSVTYPAPELYSVYLNTTGDPPYSFHVRDLPPPNTLIAVYLQATDKSGLSDDIVVAFLVASLPPACVVTPDNFVLPLVTPLGATLYSLQCSDSSNLTYTEIALSDYKYFTISDSGDVTLQEHVPLNVTTMTYIVEVEGEFGLATNVTVRLFVNHDYPPECVEDSGDVTLTQTYEGTRCQNVTLTCGHVPALSSYGLTINYTFTYDADVFEVMYFENLSANGQSLHQSTVRVCPYNYSTPNRIRQYNLTMEVSSELGSTVYPKWRITILYDDTPPTFNQSGYHFEVPEDMSLGSTVAQVVTGASEQDWGGGVLNGVYVLDPDLDPEFDLHTVFPTQVLKGTGVGGSLTTALPEDMAIVFNTDTYMFTVNGTLEADRSYRFMLRAVSGSTKSQSTGTTWVNFTITDVNQPPSCVKTDFMTDVDLKTPVGRSFYNVVCSDGDVDPVLRNLTYGEYSVGGFGYFSIHPTSGKVEVSSLLPTDVIQLQYDVFVRDGGGLVTNISLTFNITRDYEAQCTPSSSTNVVFLETDASGVCTQTLVTCVDTSGRSLPLTFKVIKDTTQGNIVIIDDTAETNATDFKACVQGSSSSPLLPLGKFEMVAEVSNTLRVTSVIFNVTINDVNQPPYFDQATYYVDVPEDAAMGQSVVAVIHSPSDPQQDGVVSIVRGDPDTVTPSFAITSLMYSLDAHYVNGTEYNVSINKPIRLNVTDVTVDGILRPDVIYVLTLMVTDGGGLSASSTLEVSVRDVNQAPSCRGPYEIPLDLLHSPHSYILSVASFSVCHDPDYNVTFNTLRYFAYPDHDSGFFNVSENGDVTLVTSIPRDKESLVLKGYAVDGGGLSDNITLRFNISRHHPPDCFPAYVPPDGVWEVDICFRIYPNCSDPTTPPGDDSYLIYSFAGGNWTAGFRKTISPNATHRYAEFCYTRTTDGVYTVPMEVNNGLGTYGWKAIIHLLYRDAPPKFTVNHYIAEVNENATLGLSVIRVEAVKDGQSASLLYSLTGSSVLGQYFSVDSSSGQVIVTADLNPLVATTIRGQVTAQDPKTGLNHSVPFDLKVLDVNQPPTCEPRVIATLVTWTVEDTDHVATLNCSDPDPTPGFSNLNYRVEAGKDVWQTEQNEVRLISRALLDPNRDIYPLTVVASDGVFLATVSVTVTVDRTPPKPVLTVSDVQSDSVNISWTFDDAYLPVIQHFNLTVTPGTWRANFISKTTRSYVIDALMSEQQYSAYVEVQGLAGYVRSDDVNFETPATVILAEACTELHLVAEPWTDDLANNQSQDFHNLQRNLTDSVNRGLRGLHGYVGCKIRSFRSGSVYADVLLMTNQSLSSMGALRSAVISLVSSSSISGTPVNSSYSPFYISGFYVTGMRLDYTSPGKISNAMEIPGYHLLVSKSDVKATCVVRTPGYWHPVFEWQLGGKDISNLTSSGRIIVSEMVRAASDLFQFTSTVTLRRLFESESGRLVCRVTAGQKTESSQLTLHVVARVSARLAPPTAYVISGDNVTLTCTRTAGYDANWRAVVYRLESSGRVEVGRYDVNMGENSTRHGIPVVTSRMRHQCNVSDDYGWALSNQADVIIVEREVRLCPEDGIWPPTPAGNRSLPCPEGYNVTGLQRRTCNAEGEWDNVDTSQCVRSDLQNYRNLLEEGTTINSTWDIVERVANSTSGPLLAGDVIAVTAILDNVLILTTQSQYMVEPNELEDFVKTADNVLQASGEVWLDQTTVALRLVHSVDEMGKAASSAGVVVTKPIQTNKIVLEVGRTDVDNSDIHFPDLRQSSANARYPDWVRQAKTSVFLSKYAFLDDVSEVRYSAIIYRNLTNVFSTQLNRDLTVQSELFINSPILALSVQLPEGGIRQPVQLTFEHLTGNFSSTFCQFLNFSASEEGVWSDVGCRVKSSRDSDITVCECDHLTNFAVLMSPYRPTSAVVDVLNIFSIVGCSFSILCLLLTLIIYRTFWRYVKSDRSVLLVNLCVILIVAYVTFLAGVNRVQYKTACTVVAGLLHYLWLVVFFLMLCEGLDIFISIVIIFPIKSVLLKLLIMAYGVPLIIVGVSMGITQLEGYGGDDFCWLSLKNNLLWAFVGPALAALLANFVFVALVIRALLSATSMITKANRERAKSVLKAICVMTPILGLGWIFGVMAVNNDTVVFQILFVVFNSLQGLMIFVFHALLSKQVRDGFQNKRRQSLASSAADFAGPKYLSQKRASESSVSSNDLGKTTSPVRQADRQMHRMATKMSLLDSPNLLSSVTDPPKDVGLKDPVTGASSSRSFSNSNPVPPPGVVDPFLNIHPNESSTDNVDAAQAQSYRMAVNASFKIESGNPSTFSSPTPSSPHTTTTFGMQPSATRMTTTETSTTTAVVEKQSVRHTDSLEDNEKQSNIPMRLLSRSTSSSDSRGDQHGEIRRQGQSPAHRGDSSSQDMGRDLARSQKAHRKPSVNETRDASQSIEAQQSRLDHVYGAGARISSDPNPNPSRPYLKGKGGRVVQSAESVSMTSAPKNPVYNDVMPSLSPTDRWIRAAHAVTRHPPPPASSARPLHHSHATPFPQRVLSGPSSPRRLSTSADGGLEPSPFPLFTSPRQGQVRYPAGKKPPAPQPAPKPPSSSSSSSRWHHEPPVDY